MLSVKEPLAMCWEIAFTLLCFWASSWWKKFIIFPDTARNQASFGRFSKVLVSGLDPFHLAFLACRDLSVGITSQSGLSGLISINICLKAYFFKAQQSALPATLVTDLREFATRNQVRRSKTGAIKRFGFIKSVWIRHRNWLVIDHCILMVASSCLPNQEIMTDFYRVDLPCPLCWSLCSCKGSGGRVGCREVARAKLFIEKGVGTCTY